MARLRWTITLIIVCSLPVFATVITAFRVIDVPIKQTPQKLPKSSLRDTCDDCAVDSDAKLEQKIPSFKFDSSSNKHSYEELKKAVREKQQFINQKKTLVKDQKKHYYKYDDDDDDDDDDDLELSSHNLLKQSIKPKVLSDKPLKDNVRIKLSKDSKRDDDYNDSNDNDDNEDDDDDDDVTNKKNPDTFNKHTVMPKDFLVDKRKSQEAILKKDKTKLYKQDDDNDEDDDDGESKEDDDYKDFTIPKVPDTLNKHKQTAKDYLVDEYKSQQVTDNKESQHKLVSKKAKTQLHKQNDDEDDDDDDDDDDNDDDDYISKGVINKNKDIVKATDFKIKSKSSDSNLKSTKISNTDKVFAKESHKEKATEKLETIIEKKSEIKPLFKEEENVVIKEKKHEPPKETLKDLPKKDVKVVEQKATSPEKDKVKDSGKLKDHKDDKSKQKAEVTIKKELKSPTKEDLKSTDTKDIKQRLEEPMRKTTKIEQKEKPEKKKKQNDKEDVKKDNNSENIKKSPNHTTSDSSMEHVSEALHRRNLLASEFEDYYAFFPTFSPNFSRIHNPECRRHGQILLRQLRGTKLWALNMLDATAKIPSGLLQGNGIQLGDYDQCVGSKARVQLDTGSVVKVQGKYCLVQFDVKAEHPELEVPVHLALAKNLIKSRIDDPGHFVPRFSTLSWGICLPAACEPHDAEVVVKDALKHYQHTSGLVVRVKVDEIDCHSNDESDWDTWFELPTVLTLSFYALVILLVLVATLQDFLGRKSDESRGDDDKAECDQNKRKVSDDQMEVIDVQTKKVAEEGVLSVFSLYHTLGKLLAPSSADDIGCIHGLRALSTLALLIGHKFLPLAVMPYTNRLKITETLSAPWWSVFRAGWMYTDCFLLLSGALSAKRLVDEQDSAPRRLLIRYLRLTPAHLAVILFYAYIWDKTSDGPMWGSLVTRNAQICQQSWWWNLLYIHNYFGFEDMCAPQTHQLALDMQLSLLAGIVVWLVTTRPLASKAIIAVLHAATAYSRYSVVTEHRLTMLAYHGVSVSQLYRTARLSYTSVVHRSTPYLMGLTVGVALNRPSALNKWMSILCWVTSGWLWGAVWWAGWDSGSLSYRYSVPSAAWYAALAPLAASSAIALLIYTEHNGQCGFLSRVLSSRPLALVSRLSYAIYLCQFVVFITNAGTVRTSTEFSLISLVDVKEISAIFLSSLILTLTLIIPMHSLPKFILPKTKDSEAKEIVEETPNETKTEVEKEEEKPVELPVTRNRSILAHREVLEEIPEVEVEYEYQRDKRDEGLEGILEEEEDDEEEYSNQIDEDMEIIEEEPGGEEDYWEDRQLELESRRRYVASDEQDLDDWEWTTNGRNGPQNRHAR